MKGKQRFRGEVKEISDRGTFEGILSTYGNVDLGGDLIEPGAFTKSLQENGDTVTLLWQHDSRTPIGTLTITDTPEGLAVKGVIDTSTHVGDYAYKTIKNEYVKGLSIGYDVVKSVWEGAVRHLKELRLWEGSLVTFPMNTSAVVLSVKAARERKDDFNAELAETQLLDAGWQMMSALQSSLSSIFWSGLSKADQLAIAQASIQQFSDAYMAWLPDFLDYMNQEYGDMNTMSRKRLERKEGREISDANKKKLKSAHEHISSAAELILPLCSNEAGPDDGTTSEGKAGRESKPEDIHLAASLANMRALIRVA